MTDEKEQIEPCDFCDAVSEYATEMTPDGRLRYIRCAGCGAFKREENIEPRKVRAL